MVGGARVGAAKGAGYCDPPPHLSHNRNDRRIHTPVTITLLQPAGSFVVGVATHHCHHLHPLTDLAGSTLSDHFRDVNTGEKNHGSSAREIQDLKPRPDPKPLPSFALISQRMESNTPQTLSDRFRDVNDALVGWSAANGGHERSRWQLVNHALGPKFTSGVHNGRCFLGLDQLPRAPDMENGDRQGSLLQLMQLAKMEKDAWLSVTYFSI